MQLVPQPGQAVRQGPLFLTNPQWHRYCHGYLGSSAVLTFLRGEPDKLGAEAESLNTECWRFGPEGVIHRGSEQNVAGLFPVSDRFSHPGQG